MKKIYTYILLLFILCTVNANATIWQVTVNSSSFTPSTLPNVVCGDTIGWVLGSGAPHTTTSTTIPSGATPWDAPITTSTPAFAYIVPNFAGVYNYICIPHGFPGSFTVTCTAGIDDDEQYISSSVYPNPFISALTMVNHGADAVKITDISGQVVQAISLNTSGDKSEINLDALAPGIYFLTTWSEGVIRETKKIIKTK
ncbi:T9SS type A sorting domain-containing protein [bacterium]|nr:T9SS type A sorting domain-containing protein [bacterium]